MKPYVKNLSESQFYTTSVISPVQYLVDAGDDQVQSILHMSKLLSIMGSLLLQWNCFKRIYLTIPVNNCEGKRPFSTVASVKTHIRSMMSHEKLVSLTMISIESDLFSIIAFEWSANNVFS